MKSIYKIAAAAIVIVLSLVALSFAPKLGATGTGTLTLSPSSGTYGEGKTFTVTVYENSGSSTVNAVQADLTYDQNKLQFVSLNADPPTSAFAIKAAASGGSGAVTFQMGNITALSGNQVVGTITFKVKPLTSSTTGAINFKSSSAMQTNDTPSVDVWDGNTSGGSYSLKADTTTTTTKTTKPASGGSSTSSSSTGSKTTITPSADEQKAEPAKPVEVSKVSNTDGTYLVSIKVVDGNGKAISGASVTLGSNTVQSDSTGIASFSNVAPGNYSVSVKSGKVLGKASISVDGSQPTTAVQQFEVKTKPKYNLALYAEIGAAILIILLLIGLWKGGMFSKIGSSPADASHHGVDPATTATMVSGSGPSVAPTQTGQDNLLKPTVITPGNPVGPAAPKA